jgi:hypothetical protein
MTNLEGKIVTEKGKHRLHERLNTLLIVTSSIGIAAEAIKGAPVTLKPGEYVTVECAQTDKEIRLPFVGPVEAAIAGRIPDAIELDFLSKSASPQHVVKTGGFAIVLASIVAPFLTDFYERHLDWLRKTCGDDPYKWPEVWNFARVVRNSVAHGGTIHFTNQNAAAVKWRDLRYGPSDNGRTVLFNDMSVGDFITLMFEMNDELDKLGAPIGQ